MRTTLLSLGLSFVASASFAQQPTAPACDGDVTIVRLSQVLTYHIRPPGPGRVQTGDASWNAFVQQYRDNSEIKAEYVTCMPKRGPK
jgi:hypothetical protein